MNNIVKRYILAAAVCLMILFTFSGCGSNRNYLDDIHIQLEKPESEIIREWTFLLGSGAEIYYKDAKKQIMLGQLSGGDDGYCAFKDGRYPVEVDGSKLTIKWCSVPSASIPWKEQTFELPTELLS